VASILTPSKFPNRIFSDRFLCIGAHSGVGTALSGHNFG
jgi:hypothetical protein